jgi:hypothetical protein
MSLYAYFPIALFYLALLALALWGAWLGWTRSKSPTARVFTVSMALLWAGFTAFDGWGTYRLLQETGLAGLLEGPPQERPLSGGFKACSLCYEGPAGRVYVVAASAMEGGNYVFTRDQRYALRFESGDVRLGDRQLDPGCHEGAARPGTHVAVRRARGFRIEVGPAAHCD